MYLEILSIYNLLIKHILAILLNLKVEMGLFIFNNIFFTVEQLWILISFARIYFFFK